MELEELAQGPMYFFRVLSRLHLSDGYEFARRFTGEKRAQLSWVLV